MPIQNVMRRRIAVFFLSISCILVLSHSALAASVEYTFTYDPTFGLTTIFNLPTSASAFDFYTFVGPWRGTDLQLPAGDSVTIDQFGNVAGTFLDPTKQICKNKSNVPNVIITITSPDGSEVDVQYGDGRTIATVSAVDVDSHRLAGGKVYSKNNFTMTWDAFITTTAPSDVGVDSPAFPFPTQNNLQVFYGSLDSLDDTNSWTSIFDPVAMTGCVPEPSTVSLILGSAVTCWGASRRLMKRRVGAGS